MTHEPDNGLIVASLAIGLLIVLLLTLIGFAKYDALVSETQEACKTAAALDLTKWVELCRKVEYQE